MWVTFLLPPSSLLRPLAIERGSTHDEDHQRRGLIPGGSCRIRELTSAWGPTGTSARPARGRYGGPRHRASSDRRRPRSMAATCTRCAYFLRPAARKCPSSTTSSVRGTADLRVASSRCRAARRLRHHRQLCPRPGGHLARRTAAPSGSLARNAARRAKSSGNDDGSIRRCGRSDPFVTPPDIAAKRESRRGHG
jgi:hypothetical protein